MKKALLLSALLLTTGWAGTAGADWGDWFGGGGDEEAEAVFEKTLDLRDGGRVSLDNVNGSITVRTWDRDEVEIRAEKKGKAGSEAEAEEIVEAIEIRIANKSGAIDIETILPRRLLGRGKGASVKYELTVPRQATLDLSSSNGGIRVEGVEGEVQVSTSNGGIHIEDVGGNLRAHTTNGGIKAYDIRGTVEAETTNGGIFAEMRAGRLEQDISFRTTNGSVELGVEAGLAASIDARTSNGRVKSDFGEPEGKSRKTLRVDLNGGGPTIKLSTTNGSVRLREI